MLSSIAAILVVASMSANSVEAGGLDNYQKESKQSAVISSGTGWNVEMAENNPDLRAAIDYHLDRIGIEKSNISYEKISILLNSIAFFESDFNSSAKNPESTASGLYQYVDAAKETAINRVSNLKNKDVNLSSSFMDKVGLIKSGIVDFNTLSYDELSALTFIDNMEKSGSDDALRNVLLNSDPMSMADGIFDFYQVHHTDVNHKNGSLGNIAKKRGEVIKHLLSIEKPTMDAGIKI